MKVPSLLRGFNAVAGRVAPAVPARLARNLMLRPRRGAGGGDAGGRRTTFRSGLSGLRWGASGPAVLMLHGWEGAATQFAPLAAAVVEAGGQAIALDGPAHGRSPGAEATLMSFARALQGVAAELGEAHAVVGHSLGGAAAAVALAWGMPAQRAVLMAAPASIEAYLRRFAAALALPPAATARFIRNLEHANGVPVRTFEIRDVVRGLSQAALIVHDRGDARVPFRDGEAIANAWPGARLLATHGLGHARLLVDAGVLRHVAAFVAPEPALPLRAAAG